MPQILPSAGCFSSRQRFLRDSISTQVKFLGCTPSSLRVHSLCKAPSQGAPEDFGSSWDCLCIYLWKSCPVPAARPQDFSFSSLPTTPQQRYSFPSEQTGHSSQDSSERGRKWRIFIPAVSPNLQLPPEAVRSLLRASYKEKKNSSEWGQICTGWRIYLEASSRDRARLLLCEIPLEMKKMVPKGKAKPEQRAHILC